MNLVSVLHGRKNIKNSRFCSELTNISVIPGKKPTKELRVKVSGTALFQTCRSIQNIKTWWLRPNESLDDITGKLHKKSQMSRSETTFLKESLSIY